MKKRGLIVCIILLAVLFFLLGWRIMPRLWPDIKENVLYPIFPQMRPEPLATLQPYVPDSNTSYGDPISISDSLVYYFYKDYCGYCREISPLMAGLPNEIILHDGTTSHVRLIALNKAEDKYYEIISQYYEKYDIIEERRYVPAVIIGNRYLFLRDEIVEQLTDALINGEGLHTPLLDGNKRKP